MDNNQVEISWDIPSSQIICQNEEYIRLSFGTLFIVWQKPHDAGQAAPTRVSVYRGTTSTPTAHPSTPVQTLMWLFLVNHAHFCLGPASRVNSNVELSALFAACILPQVSWKAHLILLLCVGADGCVILGQPCRVLAGGYMIDKRGFESCVVCTSLYSCKCRNECNDSSGLADHLVIEAGSEIITDSCCVCYQSTTEVQPSHSWNCCEQEFWGPHFSSFYSVLLKNWITFSISHD